MKVLVTRKDGRQEVITLVLPVQILDCPETGFDCFRCGDGLFHYFDASTGHYDGCGVWE